MLKNMAKYRVPLLICKLRKTEAGNLETGRRGGDAERAGPTPVCGD